MGKKGLFDKLWYFQIGIGATIVFLLISMVNFDTIISSLKETNIFLFIIAILFYFLINIITSYRLYFIISSIDKNARYRDIFWAHMAGMIASDVTPAKSGYMYVPIILKKKGIELKDSFYAIFFCYIADMLIRIFVGIVGIVLISTYISLPESTLNFAYIGIAFSIAMLFILIFILNLKHMLVLENILTKFSFYGKIKSISQDSTELWSIFPKIIVLTLILWILFGVEWYILAKSVNLNLDFTVALILNPLVTMLATVPVSISGLGIVESGIYQALIILGYTSVNVILFAIYVRVVTILVDSLGILVFFARNNVK